MLLFVATIKVVITVVIFVVEMIVISFGVLVRVRGFRVSGSEFGVYLD